MYFWLILGVIVRCVAYNLWSFALSKVHVVDWRVGQSFTRADAPIEKRHLVIEAIEL